MRVLVCTEHNTRFTARHAYFWPSRLRAGLLSLKQRQYPASAVATRRNSGWREDYYNRMA